MRYFDLKDFIEDSNTLDDALNSICENYACVKLIFKLVDSTEIITYVKDESYLEKYYDDIAEDNLYVNYKEDDYIYIPKNSLVSFKHEWEYWPDGLEETIRNFVYICSKKYRKEIDEFNLKADQEEKTFFKVMNKSIDLTDE